MSEVYVIAVLGESPAVLTELWWALKREGSTAVGLELWTTNTGRTAFQKALPLFHEASKSLGDSWYPHRVPEFGEREHAPGLRDGVRMRGLASSDLENTEQCQAFSDALHDRLRDLYTTRPAPTLIGSLAGGRKTMSAAMQSAFFLHAREGDRLVHVMLHTGVEQALREHSDRGAFRRYACPTEPVCGIPPEKQVLLVDVPVLRIRPLLERAGSSLATRLATEPHAALWPVFAEVGRVRAELVRTPRQKGCTLIVSAADHPLLQVSFKQEQAQVYAALARAGRDGLTLDEIHLIHHRRSPASGTAEDRARRKKRTRDLVTRLVGSVNRVTRALDPTLKVFIPIVDGARVHLAAEVSVKL